MILFMFGFLFLCLFVGVFILEQGTQSRETKYYPPIPYDPDMYEDMDPGMITAALAFQTGQMVTMDQTEQDKWIINSQNIFGVGSTPAKAYKDFMEKFNES